MLLPGKQANKHFKGEKVWPDPEKLESSTAQKSPYTLLSE